MQRKPFHPLVQAAIILLSMGVFTILWPMGAEALLFAVPGYSFGGDMEVGYIMYAMAIVGLPFGFHMGMLVARRTLWLPESNTRFPFLFISILFAIFVTLCDLSWTESQGHDYREGTSNLFLYTYIAAVQGIPILWLAYNLQGGLWLRIIAARRRRTQ